MKIKVLHVVGGPLEYGASKGANILHQALLELDVDSKLLNDSPSNIKPIDMVNFYKNIIFINNSFLKRLINMIFIYSEKIVKLVFFNRPAETFTLGFFGFDITRVKEYKEAEIIHLHWLNQGFINLSSLSKINKPVIWTMRDMWTFTGGGHYNIGFEKYESSYLSKIMQNIKKKNYNKNFHFVAVSDWLRKKAEKSFILKGYNIKKIDNNIDLKDFSLITKNTARRKLNISTKKHIILYGAQNPQSKRKGWDIFVEALKKLDKSKYYLLIFGNFWSQKILEDIGFEYKALGYITDKASLNATYCAADLFVASSIEDAWPKTFAEAMYCGTPVVCFKNTSISEIVSHKINGYVVENFNPNQLKDGIDWLSDEARKDNSINISARNRVLEFDAKVIAKKYIDLYESVLNL
jgi:glycosyltransferase involved in cell wall biosynthesis